tara:strand:- start:1044 stop:1370 length:327 start_codon:yes stop_codon:yes gene_type:complete
MFDMETLITLIGGLNVLNAGLLFIFSGILISDRHFVFAAFFCWGAFHFAEIAATWGDAPNFIYSRVTTILHYKFTVFASHCFMYYTYRQARSLPNAVLFNKRLKHEHE